MNLSRACYKWKAARKIVISGNEYSQLMTARTRSAEWIEQGAKLGGTGMNISFLSVHLYSQLQDLKRFQKGKKKTGHQDHLLGLELNEARNWIK